jgi:hypothetical protein
VLHPNFLTNAQAEIDAVVGSSRLSSLADRSHLPYVDPILSEALRLSQIIPLGIPHSLRRDDVHNGYFIPKYSVILPNTCYV